MDALVFSITKLGFPYQQCCEYANFNSCIGVTRLPQKESPYQLNAYRVKIQKVILPTLNEVNVFQLKYKPIISINIYVISVV